MTKPAGLLAASWVVWAVTAAADREPVLKQIFVFARQVFVERATP